MGNTDTDTETSSETKDHPHIHGEHQAKLKFERKIEGSPPHTWGTHIVDRCPIGVDGITPTYMGNTQLFSDILHQS